MEKFAQSRTPPAGPGSTVPGDENRTAVASAQHGASEQIPPSGTTKEDRKGEGQTKHLDKQSVEYVLRSGLAGGLAGCAVSRQSLLLLSLYLAWLYESRQQEL